MAQQQARISSPEPAVGQALSIRGASIHKDDAIVLSSGKQVLEGTVRAFNHSELILDVDGRQLMCRPWRLGDLGIHRYPGTSSNWTILRVDQNEYAV